MCSSIFLEYSTFEEMYIFLKVNVSVITFGIWPFYVYGVVLLKFPPNHVFLWKVWPNVENMGQLVSMLLICE